ncbi:hypothetical protein [Vibrio metschnikovii]|uniref:Uncharacterized protein n=1 Tax=Vibrio metschnikovii TaxID=28172 RepID=A0A9X0UJX3_VIBME|nr:hypothetical protein [Vibrio metschnikovii]MBC5853340.1 hypothetical protein [Vibrio metschnikovii]
MEVIDYFSLSFLMGLAAHLSAYVGTYLPPIILGLTFSLVVDVILKQIAIKPLKVTFGLESVELMNISPWFFMHTYRSSSLYKNTIKYSRFGHRKIDAYFEGQMRSSFIERSNRYNLMLSVALIVLIVPLHYMTFSVGGILWLGVVFGVCIRTISRSLEIVYAFTRDVIAYDNAQTSTLNKFDRIKLALTSYLENILNFTVVYTVFGGAQLNLIQSLFDSIGRSTISNVSVSISSGATLQAFAYLQVFTSLTLVVLSLAIYVGRKY